MYWESRRLSVQVCVLRKDESDAVHDVGRLESMPCLLQGSTDIMCCWSTTRTTITCWTIVSFPLKFSANLSMIITSSPLIWISNQFTVLHQIDLSLLFPHQALWQEGTTAFAKCKKNMLLQSHRFLHCSMSKRLQLEPSTPSTTISPVQTPSPMTRGYNFLNLYVFLVVIFTSVSWHAFVSILQPLEGYIQPITCSALSLVHVDEKGKARKLKVVRSKKMKM